MATIVFIHNIEQQEEQAWLKAFATLLPNEKVLLPRQIDDQQKQQVEIAIAANPDPSILEQFPNLVWVQSLWAGVESLVDHIHQLNLNRANQIRLVRLIDPQLAFTMAEAVLTWTLYLHRNVPEYQAQQRRKVWQPIQYSRASKTRVSVLGAGNLGLSAMRILQQHGFSVSCWSRTHKEIPQVTCFHGDQLTTMLGQTDILVCLLPLTNQTTSLIDSELLKLLPKGAKLINFARGPIVNHSDLIECLDNGQIEHAVLDVFDQEPLPADSELWEHPKISILPHISAMTDINTASQVAATNIKTYRTLGIMPSSVNLAKGY